MSRRGGLGMQWACIEGQPLIQPPTPVHPNPQPQVLTFLRACTACTLACGGVTCSTCSASTRALVRQLGLNGASLGMPAFAANLSARQPGCQRL